ncbi:MAG TPA: nucleotidyltransferase domain-containing protein [Spirochaetia bacterium]|nr:nucleotidyltransferase domain-containing protein [Spirochaetia bacterium]
MERTRSLVERAVTTLLEIDKWINQRTILKVYRGSHAYGTNHAKSDIDLGGVCLPPKDYLIGFKDFEQWESKAYTDFPAYNKAKTPAEITIFSLHKFVRLAFNCNPNIIEHLFVDPTHILHCDEYGRQLLENRHLFLSKKARHTFGGYAIAQLRKLHNKLPMEEAREKLTTLEANKKGYLTHVTKLQCRLDGMRGRELTDDEALLVMGMETEIKDYTYRASTLDKKMDEIRHQIGGGNHNTHGSHKELIDEYGYDTKHASHLIRLLYMGIEILTEGDCHVLRPENQYLIDIRHGKYPLEYIHQQADRLFALLDEAYVRSSLPNSPDEETVNGLLIDLTLRSLERS